MHPILYLTSCLGSVGLPPRGERRGIYNTYLQYAHNFDGCFIPRLSGVHRASAGIRELHRPCHIDYSASLIGSIWVMAFGRQVSVKHYLLPHDY
jgi:hypothetical protein